MILYIALQGEMGRKISKERGFYGLGIMERKVEWKGEKICLVDLEYSKTRRRSSPIILKHTL
jgi:hypothetical protein